jgi:sugar phosphate isomerase/epimerase
MSLPETETALTRRDFLARTGAAATMLAGAPLLADADLSRLAVTAARPAPAKRYPIGIELYAVRKELARDLPNTLATVRRLGYEVVEFYSPYLNWTLPYAKDVRTMLDDLGLRCFSTHNAIRALVPGDPMTKAIEINQILGARHIVLASPPFENGSEDDWKRLAGHLAAASEALRPHGLLAGKHNHSAEWATLPGGQSAMQLIAAGTPADFVLQLDVGTCVMAGADPVAWVQANPGRIRSAHLKDWAPGEESAEKGYRVLFGEGVAPWKPLMAALESFGGVEFYLMEQEGSRFPEFETARRCLASWKAMRRGR